MRGVANTDFSPHQESPNSMYVDEVYISAPNMQGSGMFDVQRVEALRGPQGTLFGDNADAGYVIQEGSFSLSSGHAQETEPLVVGRAALIGELALLTETRRPATATALEPSTVLRIPRSLFLKMLDGYPSAAEKLRDILTTRSNQSAADIYSVRGILDAGEK